MLVVMPVLDMADVGQGEEGRVGSFDERFSVRPGGPRVHECCGMMFRLT